MGDRDGWDRERPGWRRRCMNRGDTYIFDLQVFQPPAPFTRPTCQPGTPQNITGWFVWFTAKYHRDDADTAAVIAVTTLSGIIFTNPTMGQIQITDPAASTSGLPTANVPLYYDVQVKDLLGTI